MIYNTGAPATSGINRGFLIQTWGLQHTWGYLYQRPIQVLTVLVSGPLEILGPTCKSKHSLAYSGYEGHRGFVGNCRDITLDHKHFLLDDIRFLLEMGNVRLRVSTILIAAIATVPILPLQT